MIDWILYFKSGGAIYIKSRNSKILFGFSIFESNHAINVLSQYFFDNFFTKIIKKGWRRSPLFRLSKFLYQYFQIIWCDELGISGIFRVKETFSINIIKKKIKNGGLFYFNLYHLNIRILDSNWNKNYAQVINFSKNMNKHKTKLKSLGWRNHVYIEKLLKFSDHINYFYR